MSDLYAETVLRDGPVGYWRLNEQSLLDRVFDESGHDHHGYFVGRPTLGGPGAIEGSSNCSMSFVPNAHIEIPNSTDFSIQDSGNGLSVEVWMRPDDLIFQGEDGKQYIHWLGKGENTEMEWGYRLYSSDHSERPKRISAYAWNPQGGLGAGAFYQGVTVQESLVQEGMWLHLVACFEHYVDPCVRKAGVQLFVNGEFIQGPPSSGTLYFNEGNWSVLPIGKDAPLRIATRSATTNSFLTGGIDEVSIYPKVLTPQQVRRHYEAGVGRQQ